MAVVIETTLGDITVDLYVEKRPLTCLNFLKLCKMKYYNYNLFHTIQHGFIAQTGDPTGKGDGGQSIWGVLEGPHKQYFEAEQIPKVKHSDPGLLSMVGVENRMVGSQFFITLASDLTSLDGQHCVIGEVTEGMDILRLLNETICDSTHRPYQDVRITHTVVLDDPFNDPPNLNIPSRSPSPSAERLAGGRIAPDEEIDDTQGKTEEEIAEMIRAREAKARATILEIVGDLPDADMAPPENVLFVCKLNPVTSDDDLEIIFSRFGKINSCEVIRDKKTGDSLQYAFIEFDNKKSCEDAYFKMDNVLIDDRRIHVDFSQSVSKIKWRGKGRGVIHMDAHGKPVPDLDFNPNNERRDQTTRAYKGSNRNVSDYKESSHRSKNKEYSSEVRKRDRSPHSPKYNKYQESDSRYDGRNEKKYNERIGSRNRSKDKEYERKRNHSPDRNSKYQESNSQYYDSRNDKKYKEQSDNKESRHRSKDKEYSGSDRKRDRSRSPNRNVPNYKESKHYSRDKEYSSVDRKRDRSSSPGRNISDYKGSRRRSKDRENSKGHKKRDSSSSSDRNISEYKGSKRRSKDRENSKGHKKRDSSSSSDRNISEYKGSKRRSKDRENSKGHKKRDSSSSSDRNISEYKGSKRRSKDRENSKGHKKRDSSSSPDRNISDYKGSRRRSKDRENSKGDKKRNRSPQLPKYNKYREFNSRYDSRNEKSYKKRTSKE